MGKFTLDGSSPKVAFLSGGIGITPIRSICKYASDKKLPIDIVLLYANRTPRDIVFGEDFTQMEEQSARIRAFHVLCEAESNFRCIRGMINSEIVKKQVPDFSSRKFFLCGPPGMVRVDEEDAHGRTFAHAREYRHREFPGILVEPVASP